MRFRIQTEIFRKAIEATSHATSTGNLTPILENILLDAGYKRLVLTGNNMEMAIEYIIEKDIDVEVEGKFTLSSKFLTSYISLVQDKEILVELEKGGSVSFKTKSSQTRFKGLEADKFPTIPTVPTLSPLVIESTDLKTAIEKTLFSTANGTVRPTLAGIYLRHKEGALHFASTDSFRLSEFQIITEATKNLNPIIIPERAATELARILNDTMKNVEIYTYETQLLIVVDAIRLTSRLLSGKFPDYEAFFPNEWKSKSTILRSEFINALKQANLVARQNNYNTKIRSNLEGTIEISTGDTEIGASSISISGSVEGLADIIGINSEYLLQTLSVIREDYVSFEYKNPLSPIVIKGVPAETGKQSYRHLIMPLKV